jgi:nitrogen fixation NifU-like protein
VTGDSDLRDLYQEVILDHGKRPRKFRRIENDAHHAEGYNPLCGDKVTVYVDVRQGKVQDAAFEGSGCAISTASASVMTEVVKGHTAQEVEEMFNAFHSLVTGETGKAGADLGKLAVFSGVKEFPTRVKCATLAWHTLRAAIKGTEATVTTE